MVRLNQLPVSLKVLITALILTLGIGYGVACLQVYVHTGYDLNQTVRHYHGGVTEEEGEIYIPPTFQTLLTTSHVHSFSQPLMLGIIGFLFALTYLGEGAKILFILFSFMGSLFSTATPWLIRYLSPQWTLLLPLSQLVLMGSFGVMSLVILYDIWRLQNDEED